MTHESRFAIQLRNLISDEGVTLSWLVDELSSRDVPVSIATLSYWQTGRRHPHSERARDVVTHLEELLGARPGELTKLLDDSATQLEPLRLPESTAPLQDCMLDITRELRASPTELVRQVSIRKKVIVGANGRIKSDTTSTLLQGVAGKAARIPGYFYFDTPQPVAPRVTVEAGGVLAGDYLHPSGRVYGYAIDLDRPLTRSRTALVEVTVEHLSQPEAELVAGIVTGHRLREAVLLFQFDKAAIPEWIEEIAENESGRKLVFRTLDAGRSLHVVRAPFGPGMLGLRWGYEE